MGLVDWVLKNTIGRVVLALRSRVVARWRVKQARENPDLEKYVDDLEAAGAEVVSAKFLGAKPLIHVEFAGEWVDLEKRVRLDYRKLSEDKGRKTTAIALRPGKG